MFSLAIVEPRPHNLAWGRITIGDFSETFEADLSYWSPERYCQQWADATRRLVAGDGRAAFITSMYPPESANFIWWWPAWREGTRVLVQNQMLLFDQLDEPFDEADPYRSLGVRSRTTEDGYGISTWEAGVAEVEAFGERLVHGAA